jgi:hypothetical protein
MLATNIIAADGHVSAIETAPDELEQKTEL